MKCPLYLLLAVLAGTGACLAAAPEAARDRDVRRFLAELASPDSQIRQCAKRMLLRPELSERLPAVQDRLLQAVPHVTSEEDAVLLGYLDLPPERKKDVLSSPHTPNKVKGRLGDQAALAQGIERFRNSSTLVELRKAAGDLLYANSPTGLVEFAKRMESKSLLVDVDGNRISVLQILIQAYGEAHPSESLFQPATYLQHADISPEKFKKGEHQAYLRQVEAYFKQTHNLSVHLDPPLLLETGKGEVYRAKVQKTVMP